MPGSAKLPVKFFRLVACRLMFAGSRHERSYASHSRVNAIAAGKACTNRILWLTVTAP
jgi:hypothetical protein